MEKCIDCIHYKACADWAITAFGEETKFPYEAKSNLCEHFEPVRHGEWETTYSEYFFKCSECKCTSHPTNYCPNCGAKMDGDKQ